MEDFIFKKRIFGGFKRKQVIDCLNTLMLECGSAPKADEFKKAEKRIEELKKTVSEKDSEIQKLNKQISEKEEKPKAPKKEKTEKKTPKKKKEPEKTAKKASEEKKPVDKMLEEASEKARLLRLEKERKKVK